MSQCFNIYCENKAEAILSHAAIGPWLYSSSCNFRSPRQLWFLLNGLQQAPLPSKRTMVQATDRKAWRTQGNLKNSHEWMGLSLVPSSSDSVTPLWHPSPLSVSPHTVPLACHPKSWLWLWDFLLSLSLPPDTIPPSKFTCYPLDWSRATYKVRKDLRGSSLFSGSCYIFNVCPSQGVS